uniref:S20-locus F-box type-1 protein n=1 Tax=Petunia integrifolia subsp. inflata TaxID=212142 RepID=A0A076YHX9_PETIN|nr:S20-locus F-box type-1 protein [Petunia integrifolia subsp. inflata]
MANGILKKLPKDLVFLILSTFPVKSLLRFKCISKAWSILIQSTTFINCHVNRKTNTKDEFILFKRAIKDEEEEFKNILSFFSGHVDVLNPLFPDIDVSYMTSKCNCTFNPLIGPCDGLIALTDSIITIIFNPATRNFRLLPPSPFGCPKGYHRSVEGVGFGLDTISNYYKVVRISEVYCEEADGYPGPKDSEIDVCDLSTDSWRELDHVQLPMIYWLPCSGMLYKEMVHWFATTDISMVILCFDMSTEMFRNMKMPDTCSRLTHELYYGLVILCESFTLIGYSNPISSIDPAHDKMHIWVMIEYGVSKSWIMKYTIRPLSIESPLAVWKKTILLLQSRSGLLISYDLNSGEAKELNLNGFPDSLSVIVYKECLTSIPKGSEHSTKVQKF